MQKRFFAGKIISGLVGAAMFLSSCFSYEKANLNSINEVNNSGLFGVPSQKATFEEVVKGVEGPLEAHLTANYFLTYIPEDIGEERTRESVRENFEDRTGNCFDYATFVAGLIYDDGYSPFILSLKGKNSELHAVFLYLTENGYGVAGEGYISPTFHKTSTIEKLIEIYNERHSTDYDRYFVMDLDETYGHEAWFEGEGTLRPNRRNNYIRIE